MTVVAKFLRMLVRLYQLTLSPWVGRSCRFVPTCSNYAIEALEKYFDVSRKVFSFRVCTSTP